MQNNNLHTMVCITQLRPIGLIGPIQNYHRYETKRKKTICEKTTILLKDKNCKK